MAITYEVKMSSVEFKEGKAYDNVYFVDKTQDKIGFGKLVGLNGKGTVDYPPYAGKVLTTAINADASTFVNAQGIMCWTSAREIESTLLDEITATDNFYYTYGDRENRAFGLVKKASVVVVDSAATSDLYFRTVTTALTGTIEVAGGTLAQIDGTTTAFDTKVAVGDLIRIGNFVREVKTVDSATQLTMVSAFPAAVAAGATAYLETDLERPVYLGEDGAYTIITPSTSGLFKKRVGTVANGNVIEVNLYLDPEGSTVA